MDTLPSHDSSCYLCAGNERAGGSINPEYIDTFVFTNDFAALLENGPEPNGQNGQNAADDMGRDDDLFRAEPETGLCRVICFSPRHDLSLSRMTVDQVSKVVDVWREEYATLGARDDIGYVQIFENRGAAMGCSNPHPHGQIWATKSVPSIALAESKRQAEHLSEKGECLLCRYLARELKEGERVVFENDSFVALVPFWALWPFEVLLLPKEHMGSIAELSDGQKTDLSDALIRMGTRYDNLFQTSFPYSMGLHQQSTDGSDQPGWHWHIHYYPPLLRSATVRKFMVGYEMFAMPQRDITAESAAAQLRELSELHYTTTVK